MSLDRDTIETFRKWGTTLIVLFVVPVGGLWMKYNNLQMMQEVQDKYVQRTVYTSDISKLETHVESVSIKIDAVLQNQAAQSEHMKSVEMRLDKVK